MLPIIAFAQKVTQHTVVAKESFSSIGRLYNVNGRELANFNKLDYDKGLAIGQVIKIPSANNATTKQPSPAIVEKPVIKEPIKEVESTSSNKAVITHVVAKKETLYGVSKQYNTTVADIKKWNNLTEDALKEGSEIIVGYNNVAKQEKVAAPIKKVEPKVEFEEKPKPAPVVTEVAKVKKEPVVTKPVVAERKEIPEDAARDFKGGKFKSEFEGTGIDEEGTAGVFKSTSGWDDGKYYCLHNQARTGTIIKVTNKANGKYVYAKVLDVMPDLKQNDNLQIRISNAAADILGEGNGNFECSISY